MSAAWGVDWRWVRWAWARAWASEGAPGVGSERRGRGTGAVLLLAVSSVVVAGGAATRRQGADGIDRLEDWTLAELKGTTRDFSTVLLTVYFKILMPIVHLVGLSTANSSLGHRPAPTLIKPAPRNMCNAQAKQTNNARGGILRATQHGKEKDWTERRRDPCGGNRATDYRKQEKRQALADTGLPNF